MNRQNLSTLCILLFSIRKPNFPNRYISPKSLQNFLQENLSDYITLIGTSTLGEPIYQFSYGSGDIKVLAWSQMHGNESNSTHCMLDLWYSLESQPQLKEKLFQNISLDFILCSIQMVLKFGRAEILLI